MGQGSEELSFDMPLNDSADSKKVGDSFQANLILLKLFIFIKVQENHLKYNKYLIMIR